MRNLDLNIIGIIGATVLFLSFTLIHEYDWLIPESPVATVADTSPIPLPDVAEEQGSEDEIGKESLEIIYLPEIKKEFKKYMISEELYIPSVSTPPPDVI